MCVSKRLLMCVDQLFSVQAYPYGYPNGMKLCRCIKKDIYAIYIKKYVYFIIFY